MNNDNNNRMLDYRTQHNQRGPFKHRGPPSYIIHDAEECSTVMKRLEATREALRELPEQGRDRGTLTEVKRDDLERTEADLLASLALYEHQREVVRRFTEPQRRADLDSDLSR